MTTSFGDLLVRRREAILAEWQKRILETYPEPARRVFGRGGDRFRNPVADVIRRGTETVLTALARDASPEELTKALDGIVRLRAVQDFRPSAAVSFVFSLKDAVRAGAGEGVELVREISDLDRHVDALALLAFDVYAGCRDRIAEIRVREAKARVMKLLERAEAGVGKPNPGGETE